MPSFPLPSVAVEVPAIGSANTVHVALVYHAPGAEPRLEVTLQSADGDTTWGEALSTEDTQLVASLLARVLRGP